MDAGDILAIVAMALVSGVFSLRMYLRAAFPRPGAEAGGVEQLTRAVEALREEIAAQRQDAETHLLDLQERLDFVERVLARPQERPRIGGGKTTPV